MLTTIDAGLGVLLLTGLVLYIFWRPRQLLAIRGSYERYKATTVCVVASSAVVISEAGISALAAFEQDFFRCFMSALVGIFWLFILISLVRDDNWFNDQFKRLKKGWKKLRSWRPRKLVTANPLPSLSPN